MDERCHDWSMMRLIAGRGYYKWLFVSNYPRICRCSNRWIWNKEQNESYLEKVDMGWWKLNSLPAMRFATCQKYAFENAPISHKQTRRYSKLPFYVRCRNGKQLQVWLIEAEEAWGIGE